MKSKCNLLLVASLSLVFGSAAMGSSSSIQSSSSSAEESSINCGDVVNDCYGYCSDYADALEQYNGALAHQREVCHVPIYLSVPGFASVNKAECEAAKDAVWDAAKEATHAEAYFDHCMDQQ